MKKTLNLIMMLWAVVLASCSADEPQTISATEDYNREFVKEFGVPAAGHDFSMATTAGLKVTSKNGDHITVTAEIDGTEYLFADCHVPAGTTAIPVTIPRTVSELKLATTRGELSVATNALVNLDEIETTPIRRASPPTDAAAPYIAFKQSDFLDGFLNAYPQEISEMSPISPYYIRRHKDGYVFPVYWSKDLYGLQDYHVLFSQSYEGRQRNDLEITEVDFSAGYDDSTTPFPRLRYFPYWDSVSDIVMDHYFHDAKSLSPYPDESFSPDYMIISKGIRLKDFVDQSQKNDECFNWFLELEHGQPDNSPYSISSESPYRNIANWYGYFDVPLRALNTAYVGACHYPIENGEFYIADEELSATEAIEDFKKITAEEAYLIGFNSAPLDRGYSQPRTYSDAVFLFIPIGRFSSYDATVSTGPYEWTIAAEDLGATDDWDFNDAVFTFSDQIKDLNSENINSKWSNTREWGPRDAQPVRIITVTPKAAGGTMPLYITYTGVASGQFPGISDGSWVSSDKMYFSCNEGLKAFTHFLESRQPNTYILGKEIHEWLGEDTHTTMINTGASDLKLKPEPVQFAIPLGVNLGVGYDPDKGYVKNGSLMASAANKTLCGFAVVVDKAQAIVIKALRREVPQLLYYG
ncbi:MAG: hypothetical protein K2L99_01770, partial [Muribaculaceae bacterium]|nr:hypothetical protein [Muribaculaceae bacterium]